MTRVLGKARDALLTDPVTKEPLDVVDMISLVSGLVIAVIVILAMVILALGMGSGQ